jgi:outer membrane protein assembly factor BamB
MSIALGLSLVSVLAVAAPQNDLPDVAWSTTADVGSTSDAALRVWLEPGDDVAVVWVKSPNVGGLETFVLERRDVATGNLLSTFRTQNLFVGNGPAFKPSLSHDRRYVAVERTSITGRLLSVFDIQSGALVWERDFGALAIEVFSTWDPNTARVHYTTRGTSTIYFGVADAVSGLSVWETQISGGVFFNGHHVPHGLAVDPSSGDQVVSYDSLPGFPTPGNSNVITRRDGATGAADWSFVSPNTITARYHRDHRDWSNLAVPAMLGEELTALQFSPDGTNVLAIDTHSTGASTASRFAALDATTGGLLWVKSPDEPVGFGGRALDFAASLDGRFVHVLSEGRGASAANPSQLLLSTFSQADGSFLWKTWIDAPEGRARRVASLGNGWRVAVLGNADTDAAAATGGFLATFDAENGVELARHTFADPERGDLCDAAFAVDRTAVLVGAQTVATGDTDALIRRLDPRTLTQGPDFHSLSLGGHNEYHIDFDASLAGHVYIVVGSVSGIAPGLPLPGGWVLPLNYDGYTLFTQTNVNSHNYVNSLGLLDLLGDTRMRLFIPGGEDRIFAGLPFAYAAVALEPLGGAISGVTNAAQLDMQL